MSHDTTIAYTFLAWPHIFYFTLAVTGATLCVLGLACMMREHIRLSWWLLVVGAITGLGCCAAALADEAQHPVVYEVITITPHGTPTP